MLNSDYEVIFCCYNYSNSSTADRKSWEGFLGCELNLFNMGDLSLLTQIVAYPSFTESGRWRSDFSFDAKYDLPLDFYVKLGYTLNFDNRPAEGSVEQIMYFMPDLAGNGNLCEWGSGSTGIYFNWFCKANKGFGLSLENFGLSSAKINKMTVENIRASRRNIII